MQNKQKEFLKSVKVKDECDALKNTVKASFARNKLYENQPTMAERKRLHKALKDDLQTISARYNRTLSEEQHCGNIQQLADCITNQFSKILEGERFKIGTAQKALNLYLKFRWCLGIQKAMPPHCPLDSKILKKAAIYKPWTKMDCIETYKCWVEKLKEKAKANHQSLPEWELKIYQSI